MRIPRGTLMAVPLVAMIATPAVAAPEQVMSVPPRAPSISTPAVFALPSGGLLVTAASGADLRYAVRYAGRWRAARPLPRLYTGISAVSAAQQGRRVQLAWLGRGATSGSRALVFADFRGIARPPRLHRMPRNGVALDPQVSAGPGPTARAVWQEGFTTLAEGVGDATGAWTPLGTVPVDAAGTAPWLAADATGRRLVVVAVRRGPVSAPLWAVAGPQDTLPALRPLLPDSSERSVAAVAPVLRASGDPAVVVGTVGTSGPLIIRLEAVSISGDTPAVPRVISADQRLALGAPLVASLPDGRLVAVWRRLAPPRVQVMVANETAPGGEWTAPLVISPPGSRPGVPSLVVSGAGLPVVGWSDGMRATARVLEVGARARVGAVLNLSPGLIRCLRPSLAVASRTLTAAFTCDAGRTLHVNSVAIPQPSR